MQFFAIFIVWAGVGLLSAGAWTPQEEVSEWWTGPGGTGTWFGARNSLEERGLEISGKWLGTVYWVVDGGLERRAFFDEEIKFDGKLDFFRLTGWEALEGLTAHGSVRFRGGQNVNTAAGSTPAFNPSSYQSGVEWRLMPFYLSYTTPRLFGVEKLLTLSGGWQNPYEFFARQEDAKFFRNNVIVSGKGISTDGVGWSSSYAAWGGMLKVQPTDWSYVQGGVYMAIPGDTDSANHGFGLAGAVPAGRNGWFVLGEAGVKPAPAGLAGKYAVGGYYWGLEAPGFLSGSSDGRFGFYAMGDQALWMEPSSGSDPKGGAPAKSKQGLRALGFVSFAPEWNNAMPFFFYTGLVYEGLIPGRERDQTGVALALGTSSSALQLSTEQSGNSVTPDYEGVLEFDYRVQVNTWAFVQPFLQYTIRPGATGLVANATILGIHMGIQF